MRRRTYLTTIGVVTGTALAGCSGNTDGNNSSNGGDTNGGGNATESSGETSTSGGSTAAGATETAGAEPTAASTATEATDGTRTPTAMREPSPTAMATSTSVQAETSTNPGTAMPTAGSTTMGGMSGGNGDVSVDSSEFSKQTDAGITDTAMVGELTAPSYLSSIELQARFRNDAGDILDTDSAYFQGLENGQTWEFYVPSLASETPADGEVEVASATAGSPPSDPGAKVVESSLNDPADEFSGPTVTGRAKNTSGSTLPYLEARIHFLADDGTALESDYTNVTDLPAGETWSFELEAITFPTDPRPEIADFDVTLASGL